MCLTPDTMDFGKLKLTMLNGDNFQDWKFRVTSLLMSMDLDGYLNNDFEGKEKDEAAKSKM